jgi:hypothetical protein
MSPNTMAGSGKGGRQSGFSDQMVLHPENSYLAGRRAKSPEMRINKLSKKGNDL